MTPGRLDQRVTLQRRARVADGQGGYTETWVALRTVWASVRALSGREREYAAAAQAPATYRVTIRRYAELTAADRVVWQGEALNIRFVADNGPRERYLHLDCERGVVA